MAYWVHIERDRPEWFLAQDFEPPAPMPEGSKGYPVICVESEKFVFRFSSFAQLAEAVIVLSASPLPTTRRLSAMRPGGAGPNGHWLSRLPGHIKSPRTRQRVVQDLANVMQELAPNYALKRTVREEVPGAITRCGPNGRLA